MTLTTPMARQYNAFLFSYRKSELKKFYKRNFVLVGDIKADFPIKIPQIKFY
jgi:hypothetical protein